MLRSILLLALAPALLAQDIDPVRNFCRRWDHQSIVKNGSLYIDGGLETFVQNSSTGGNQTETIGFNTALLQIDLTNSWNWKTNLTVNQIEKGQNPQTGTDAPLLVRSALYQGTPDDTSFYLYGGTVSFSNTSFPGWQQPLTAQYALWSYSTTDQTWSQYDVSLDEPNRPNSGAYIDAAELGLGFYHNGEIDSGSQTSLQSLKNFRGFVPGMVVVDTAHQTARNVSTDALQDNPRARHRMVYIPGIGEKGILVTVGGVTKSVYDGSSSSRGSYLSMANIDIFDVASMDSNNNAGVWHRQQATGAVPDSRADFCLVAATAPDNSSYNIYLYGGRDDSRTFDQVYVLSLPSFKWVKVWEGSSPKWGHTCHAVGSGSSQMITVGGVPDSDFTNGCDWETKGVAIYNLSNGIWGSVYDAFDEAYQVPPQVYKTIGGGATGNATSTSPTDGFSSKPLAALFNGTSPSSSSSSSPLPSNSHHSISKGSIAGAVVGSVIGAALIAAALIFLLLRRRRQQAATNEVNANDQKQPWLAEADSQVHQPRTQRPGTGPAELGGDGNGLHEMSAQGVVSEMSSAPRSEPRKVIELP